MMIVIVDQEVGGIWVVMNVESMETFRSRTEFDNPSLHMYQEDATTVNAIVCHAIFLPESI